MHQRNWAAPILRGALIGALMLASFTGGYFARAPGSNPSATPTAIVVDEYLVGNLLHELVYAGHLRNGRHELLAELVDIRLNDHLERMRQASVPQDDGPLALARLRTLADVADWWFMNPPTIRAEVREQSWFAEWERSYLANLDFVDEAKRECLRVGCRPANASLARTSWSGTGGQR